MHRIVSIPVSRGVCKHCARYGPRRYWYPENEATVIWRGWCSRACYDASRR